MTSAVPDVSTDAEILSLGNSFCHAQVLMTAVEFDLFTVLHDGPATEEEIRGWLGLDGRGLCDFLDLLVALGVLGKDGSRYRNGVGADRYLVSGQQSYIGGYLLGAKFNLYHLWAGLSETMRTGKPRESGDSFEAMLNDQDALRRYVNMMDGTTEVFGPRLAEALDWSGSRSVLDVGGCRGSLVGHLVKAHAELSGLVFDLPQLEPLFDEQVAALGLADRISFRGGDFFRVALPPADVVILGHILHNWSPRQREHLLGKAYEAVNPGGALLIYDRMLDDGRSNLPNLVASLIMLLVTDCGSEYAIGELRGLVEAAGFTSVTHQPLDEYETLMICRK